MATDEVYSSLGERDILENWRSDGLPTGDQHIGKVGKTLAVVSASFLVDDGSNYAALDVCATPTVPTLLENCARVSGGAGVIRDAVVVDRGDQEAPVTIVLLSGSPANSFGNDNAALAFNDVDADLVVGTISCATTDYRDFNTNQVAYKNGVDIYFDCATGQKSLWALVQADGAWNAGGDSDLGVTLKIEQL